MISIKIEIRSCNYKAFFYDFSSNDAVKLCEDWGKINEKVKCCELCGYRLTTFYTHILYMLYEKGLLLKDYKILCCRCRRK